MPLSRRLIRRQPFRDRVKAWLNPLDFWLWFSEELNTSDWDQRQLEWATPVGVGLNFVMLLARANTGASSRRGGDDVFGEELGMSWVGWFASSIVILLSVLSCVNAAYTFYRKRHYRLFESSIETPLTTPSAHRVKVDSSPLSSSPLRHLQNILAAGTAQSRAFPDTSKDVWELLVWDPTPVCLKMFCLFSPGHVLVYWQLLPTKLSDPTPSTTVLLTLALSALLFAQLSILQSNFSQQIKDTAVIQKEVMNEYDTKYVHPQTRPLMRDVGTQYKSSCTSPEENVVDTYMPVFVVNKGFRTNPNPNYAGLVDPDHSRQNVTPSRNFLNAPSFQTPVHLRDLSSPIQPRTAVRQSAVRSSIALGRGDGGSLGVYTHAQSPLKRAASTNFLRERSVSPIKRDSDIAKRSSTSGAIGGMAPNKRLNNLNGTSARRESGRF